MIYARIALIFFLIPTLCSFSSCKKETNPTDTIPKVEVPANSSFVMGVDLSYVNQIEDKGGVFKEDGVQRDPFILLKEHGANMVRLRLWHNPSWVKDIYGSSTTIYSGYLDVKKSIKRAKEIGLAVNLDFHYSDIWADPSHQTPPEAWKEIVDINVLADSVYNYTYNILSSLLKEGLMPEMVQIGNETNCGMMMTKTNTSFPKLNICEGNWANFGKVINAGINAVRKIDTETGTKTKIALHVADPKNLDWWFSDIIDKGGVSDFDIIGFSYYHNWHTTVSFAELPSLVTSIKSKFNKELMVLETAYPFTKENNDSYNNIFYDQPEIEGFPYTPEGQRNFLITLTKNMVSAGATGVMYWEPAWITSQMTDLWGTGSTWDNCALFDFSGNITSGADYLDYNYSE